MSVLPRLVPALLALFAVAANPSPVDAKTAAKAKPATAAAKPVATAPAERFPLTSVPAFEVVPLTDWKVNRSTTSLQLTSPDTATTLVYLTWEDNPRKPLGDDAIAAGIFENLGSAPPARKEPITISGRPALNYVGQMIRDDGMQIDLNLIIVRISPTQALLIATMSQFGDGGAGQAQAKAQLAKTRIVTK